MVGPDKGENFLPLVLPLPWTSAWGEDEFGVWVEFDCREVVQRLRWIPPGKFLMGSPADEPERSDDETEHEVELTQGFWLADTACTQALWEAVMGTNPSGFRGPERPVEQVSWNDCQEFLVKVNRAIPGLDLELPTEAQWEYACRAGTSTPFSFGETITTEQVNYNGNYPYTGGAKGLFRGETRPVKSFLPNQWGLYEMHGNVWEWCQDWYGPYEKGRLVDPRGPAKGGDRVVRGGSWILGAGDCRSAGRSMDLPGNRSGDIGVRLSRGQEGRAKQTGKEETAVAKEAQRSGAEGSRLKKGLLKKSVERFLKKGQ